MLAWCCVARCCGLRGLFSDNRICLLEANTRFLVLAGDAVLFGVVLVGRGLRVAMRREW